jgi:flagellar biosynthesis/type III secretory pathway chaperone
MSKAINFKELSDNQGFFLTGVDLKKLLLQATATQKVDNRFKLITRTEAKLLYGNKINADWFRKQEQDPNTLLKMTNPKSQNSPVLYSKGSIEQEIERLLS